MSTEAVNGWQTDEAVPQSPRGERVTWGIAITVVALLVAGVAGYYWHQNQLLAGAASSVPANMELVGATRGEVTRHYTGAASEETGDTAPTLTVTYALSDPEAALASLEDQMRADGWTLDPASIIDGMRGEHWVKPGSGIEYVDVEYGSDLRVVLRTGDQ